MNTLAMLHPRVVSGPFMFLALTFALFAGAAQAKERFAQKLSIAPGLVAVVAEGDFEARSIGSYSVRVYFDPAAAPENETTFYAAGLLRPRDGTVLSITPLQVNRNERPLLMVVVQSTGSGGYLSADAFTLQPHSVRLKASISGLSPSDDPAAHLRRKLASAK